MGVWTMLLAAIAALVVPTAGKDNTSLDDDTATHVLFFLVDDLCVSPQPSTACRGFAP